MAGSPMGQSKPDELRLLACQPVIPTTPDAAARDAYLPHPEHVALGQTLLRPIADDVLVMDYAI